MEKDKVRTRVAPSPTGPLHVGTARAALFNELFARSHKGSFLLRIEDTDASRSRKEYELSVEEGLKWLGLKWDEKIVRQSERSELYQEAVQRLLATGAAYQEGGDGVVKLKVPPRTIEFFDLIRGRVKIHTDTWGGDFIIARTLAEPLYHLAVVVDDAEMNISHVIRGEDHISNTPKHILLQKALGYSQPQWAHLPLLLNEQRRKLSKRDQEVDLLRYQEEGYLPEALLNYLALLGWSPGDDREFFTHQELIRAFNLNNVQKGGAVFSATKLRSINKHYLKRLSGEELLERIRPHWKNPRAVKSLDRKYLKAALDTERERVSTLGELAAAVSFFMPGWPADYDPLTLVWRKSDKSKTIKLMEALIRKLQQWPPGQFSEKQLKRELLHWIDREKLGRGDVLWPMRVAMTGQENSPGPFEVASVLGKNKSLERLRGALDKLKKL